MTKKIVNIVVKETSRVKDHSKVREAVREVESSNRDRGSVLGTFFRKIGNTVVLF